MHLKVAHWLPVAHPIHGALGDWAQSLEDASGGTLTTSIHPAEELGKGPDHYDMVVKGSADVALTVPGCHPHRFPLAAVADQPFMFADAMRGSRAFDAWYRFRAGREMPHVHYCFTYVMGPGLIHSKRRIAEPSDLSGMRLRPPSATMAALFGLMGADVRRYPLIETPAYVERGELDGVAVPWGGLFLFDFDKTFHHHFQASLYGAAFTIVLSKQRYEEMTAIQRDAIARHSTIEWAERFGAVWTQFEDWGRRQIIGRKDHEIVQLKASDLDVWRATAAPLKAEWIEHVRRAGGNPDAIWDELTNNLMQAGATPQ